MNLDLGGAKGYRTLLPYCPDSYVLSNFGFAIVDLYGANIIHDLRTIPYPFEDGSIALIHCSHTLEHLGKEDAINLLKESYRILTPGGIITLAVPDMDVFIEGHLTGDWSKHPERLEKDMNFCAAGGKFPSNHPDSHKYMWCFESLAYVLEKIGYTNVERHGHDNGPHKDLFPGAYNRDFESCSLYIDAVKGNCTQRTLLEQPND